MCGVDQNPPRADQLPICRVPHTSLIQNQGPGLNPGSYIVRIEMALGIRNVCFLSHILGINLVLPLWLEAKSLKDGIIH